GLSRLGPTRAGSPSLAGGRFFGPSTAWRDQPPGASPVQLTLLPQIGLSVNRARSTSLSALALGVAVVELTAGRSPATTVPRKTARTRPLTVLNAAFGLSASRRAARSADAPVMDRASSRAAWVVSHGPPTTRPTRMRIRPGNAGAPMDLGVVMARPTLNRAIPSRRGASRQALGAGGVVLRVTPSGEIVTRRSDNSAAIADATGTATSTAR